MTDLLNNSQVNLRRLKTEDTDYYKCTKRRVKTNIDNFDNFDPDSEI